MSCAGIVSSRSSGLLRFIQAVEDVDSRARTSFEESAGTARIEVKAAVGASLITVAMVTLTKWH